MVTIMTVLYTEAHLFRGKVQCNQCPGLRLFAQHSDISNRDEINFLAEYRIKPGTFLYFVINRQRSNGVLDTQYMIKFKSYAGI